MAILSPEQQAAYVAQQTQDRLYADGQGQQAPPGFVSAIEGQATSLTFGLTNLALPAAGMLGAIGADMVGLDIFTLGKMGNSGGKAASEAIRRLRPSSRSLATLGKMARVGGLVGGIGAGVAIPMGIMGAADYAGNHLIEGQREFMATRGLVREFGPVGGLGPQSVMSPASPGSFGGDHRQVAQFQSFLSSMAPAGATQAQMRNLASGMNSQGMIDGRSAQAASDSFRKSLQELQSLGARINADLETALQTYGALKQLGLTDRASRLRALGGMAAVSGLTGQSLPVVSQFASMGAQGALQAGLSAQTGMGIALGNLTTSHLRSNAGVIDPTYLARVGGVQGHAQRMAAIDLGVGSTPGGYAMMSQMFSPSGGLRDDYMGSLSGRRLREDRSFTREMDPYAMPGMQQNFQQMQGSLILARVGALQSGEGTRIERNRRQYDFLQSVGISDPTEQLEYLSQLRSAPRSSFAAALQGQQDEGALAVGASGPEPSIPQLLRDKIDRVFRDLTGNIGENLERFGAALQVRAERVMRDIGRLAYGQEGGFAVGRVSMADMDTIGRSAAGGNISFLQRSSMDDLRTFLGAEGAQGDRIRAALGGMSEVGGRTIIQPREERGLMANLITGAAGMAIGSQRLVAQRLSRHLGLPDLSRGHTGMSQGMGPGQPGGSIYGGINHGRPDYLTEDEFLTGAASRYGLVYNPTDGQFAAPNEGLVESYLMRGGEAIDALESRTIAGLRMTEQEARAQMTAGERRRSWALKFAGMLTPGSSPFAATRTASGVLGREADNLEDSADREGMGSTVILSEVERALLASASPALLDQFAVAMTGKPMGELNAEQRASVNAAMARRGGAVASAISPDGARGQTVSGDQFAAATFTTIGIASARAAFGQGANMSGGDPAVQQSRFQGLADVTEENMDAYVGAGLGLAASGMSARGIYDQMLTPEFGGTAAIRQERARVAFARGGIAQEGLAELLADPVAKQRLIDQGIITEYGNLIPSSLGENTLDIMQRGLSNPMGGNGLVNMETVRSLQDASRARALAGQASYRGVRNQQSEDSLRTLRGMRGESIASLLGAVNQTLGASTTPALANAGRLAEAGNTDDMFSMTQDQITAAITALESQTGGTADEQEQRRGMVAELNRSRALFAGGNGALNNVGAYIHANIYDREERLSGERLAELRAGGIYGLEGLDVIRRAQSQRGSRAMDGDAFMRSLRTEGGEQSVTALNAALGGQDVNDWLNNLRGSGDNLSQARDVLETFIANLAAAGTTGVSEGAVQQERRNRIEAGLDEFLGKINQGGMIEARGIRVFLHDGNFAADGRGPLLPADGAGQLAQ